MVMWLAIGGIAAYVILPYKVGKKEKLRNQYNQVPHLTQDTVWESDINTRKHHLQESQEGRLFQQVATRLHDTYKTI